jgi:mono/diheme cytochrome c family protein
MRCFLLIFALCVVVVMAVAGKRGSTSRRPPIEIFSDMDRQPKVRPQTSSEFFSDGMGSRLPVAGTFARSKPYQFDGKEVYPYEDAPVNTGKITGTTNFVETIPLPVTARLMERGQQRFNIYCSPCHGAQGDGKGITSKLGMAVIADLHDGGARKVVQQPDGQIFNTITYGKTLMGAYGGIVSVEDRWAIIAYVRALQRSHLASIEDVPGDDRSKIPNPPPAGAKTNAPPTAAAAPAKL